MALSGAVGEGRNPEFASRFLDTVGDGSGSIAMNTDGSTIPVEFTIICPPNKMLVGSMFKVTIEDTIVSAAAYGGIFGGLDNGITGFIQRVGEPRMHLFQQLPILTNSDWLTYCSQHLAIYGAGADTLSFVYDFAAEGPGFILYPGDYGGLTVNDDLTGILKHVCRFGVTQYDYSEPVR